MPLLDQPAPEKVRHLQAVLDHEDAHPRHILAWKMRAR
jgi:hypothetical protein